MIRQITPSADRDRWPKVGADGQQVVFISRRDGNWSVFSVSRQGGEDRQLTDSNIMNLGAALSPDGQQLAIAEHRLGSEGVSDLYLSAPDGTARRRVAEGGMWPSWLADGSGVLFIRDNGSEGALDIMLYRAEADRVTRLTDRDGDDVSAVVSPDGQWLYYAQGDNGVFELFRRPLVGGTDEALGIPINIDSGPAISPDGRYMVYGYNAGSGYDLYRLDLQTRERFQITGVETPAPDAQ